MSNVILQRHTLGFPWKTLDPFLFCVHHDDRYPAANADLGPASSLGGRDLGQDFSRKDGWSMYHGATVPGFPAHPHRGFETVTLVRHGLIDHSDSLGARARFGQGDVQWLTAGRGVVHAEMFPLLRQDAPNPLELFQIWLNLPAADKLAEPHFAMLWSADMPRSTIIDDHGHKTEIRCVAGRLGDRTPPAPPPRSWAARPEADVAIWTLALEPGARWTLPAAVGPDTCRMLYFFAGDALHVGKYEIDGHCALELDAGQAVELTGGAAPVELLLLQGKPINEPVAQYGPFVMNNEDEIRQAVVDYRTTGYGGWPWPNEAPVHGADAARFADRGDGNIEYPVSRQET